MEETTAASHGLAREVSSLSQLLAQFKTTSDVAKTVEVATSSHRLQQASPVRSMTSKIATAFIGNTAVKTDWTEF